MALFKKKAKKKEKPEKKQRKKPWEKLGIDVSLFSWLVAAFALVAVLLAIFYALCP